MDRVLGDFVRLLRRNRVRVSTAEGLDALSAVESVGLAERDVVRDALRATLVKSPEDLPAFERLFDLYFGLGHERRPAAAHLHPHHHGAGGSPTELRFGEDLEADPLDDEGGHSHEAPEPVDLRRFLEEEDIRPSTDLHGEPERLRLSVFGSQLMLSRSQDALEAAMRRQTHQLKVRRARSFEPGGVAPETGAEELPLDLTTAELVELVEDLREEGVDEGLLQAIEAQSEEILAALPELLRSLRERQDRLAAAREDADPGLGALPLRRRLDLSPREKRELEAAIRRLGRQLRGATTRRQRRDRVGRISVPHTLRQNLAYEGIPFRPVFRRRREGRPRLCVLLDVSVSTRNLARLWLHLVYELQSLFSKVRTFAFVADLVEVTSLLEDRSLAAATEAIFGGELLDVDENSDFGRAAELFRTEHLSAVSRRTTVVVLGDGRNNGRPPGVAALEDVARHARRHGVAVSRATLELVARRLRHASLRAGLRLGRGGQVDRRPGAGG
ncbi:MAG: VWA domain-containing protein, partial [Thermoleophilaceae bacterium]